MSAVQSTAVSIKPAPVIEINIRGNRSHIGKTVITELIRRSLAKYGLDCNIECQDSDISKFELQDLEPSFGSLKQLGLTINLIDNNERLK